MPFSTIRSCCSSPITVDWKLVTTSDRDSDAWELYDLTYDRSETVDMSGQRPEIVKTMIAKWRVWAKSVNALPFPEDRAKSDRNPMPELPVK